MNSEGHRDNILGQNFKDIGIGVEEGRFDYGTQVVDSVIITQDFARSSARQKQAVAFEVPTEAPARDGLFDSTEANGLSRSFIADDFLF